MCVHPQLDAAIAVMRAAVSPAQVAAYLAAGTGTDLPHTSPSSIMMSLLAAKIRIRFIFILRTLRECIVTFVSNTGIWTWAILKYKDA